MVELELLECGERPVALLEQLDHAVEGGGEVAHVVHALAVVAARDLLRLPRELPQARVQLLERGREMVVPRRHRGGELATREGQ